MKIKKSVFNSNHIDPKLSESEINEFIKLCTFFIIKKVWLFKRAYKHFNKLHLISNLTSTGLIVIGTIGGGGGGVTQTSIVLGVISGSGLLLKTSTEDKNLMTKIELCRFALTSYEKYSHGFKVFHGRNILL